MSFVKSALVAGAFALVIESLVLVVGHGRPGPIVDVAAAIAPPAPAR